MNRIKALLLVAVTVWMGCAAEERNPTGSDVPVPGGFQVVSVSPDSVQLAWEDSSDSETGYRIERSATDGQTWAIMADLPVNSTAYTDTRIGEGDRLFYRLRAREGRAASPPSNPVVVSVPLIAPRTLIVRTPVELQVRLQWDDLSQANSGYEIYRHGEAGEFIQIGWTASNVYIDSTIVLAERFTYRVRAVKDSIFSEFSPTAPAVSPFYAPARLVGTRLSITAIRLTWRDSSRVEDSYQVERKGEGGMYHQLVTLPANSIACNDTGLIPASIYYYRVRAIDERQLSNYSNEVRVETTVLTPPPPTELNAESHIDNPGKILLRWIDNATNEDGYSVEIYRGVEVAGRDDGYWEEIEQLPADAIDYESMPLEVEKVYDFRVRAFNQEGPSDYSNIASAQVVGIPLAPFQLAIELPDWQAAILHWRQESEIEDGFRIERVDPPGVEWRLIAEVAADCTTFADSTIEQLHSYLYRVAAYNQAGVSPYTDSVGVEVPDFRPAAPSNMTATARTWLAAIVGWQDNSIDETGFQLERRQGGFDRWEPVAALEADATTFNDSTVIGGANYLYRVRSFNDAGVSDWASESAVQIPDRRVPLPPAVMAIVTVNSRAVTLRWIHNDNLEDGFCIQRKYSFDWEWLPDSTILPGNTVTFTDSTVIRGDIYTYRVWAFNAVGNSEYSNEVTVEIPEGLPAPHNLTAEAVGIDRIQLNWEDPTDTETGFTLERSESDQVNFEMIALLEANTVSFLDSQLTPETVYHYRASCYNDGEVSGYSEIATAQTQSLLVFSDDFESYWVNAAPVDPWVILQTGESSAIVIDSVAFAGSQSMEIRDGSEENVDYVSAKVGFDAIMNGSLECRIMLAPNGYFGINTFGGPLGIYNFNLQFEPDGQILCRNGRGQAYNYGNGNWTPNEWMLVKVVFDVETNLYSFWLGDRLVAPDYEMQDTTFGVDHLQFIAFAGARIEFARVDDVKMSLAPRERVNGPLRQNRPRATGEIMDAGKSPAFIRK